MALPDYTQDPQENEKQERDTQSESQSFIDLLDPDHKVRAFLLAHWHWILLVPEIWIFGFVIAASSGWVFFCTILTAIKKGETILSF